MESTADDLITESDIKYAFGRQLYEMGFIGVKLTYSNYNILNAFSKRKCRHCARCGIPTKCRISVIDGKLNYQQDILPKKCVERRCGY